MDAPKSHKDFLKLALLITYGIVNTPGLLVLKANSYEQ